MSNITKHDYLFNPMRIGNKFIEKIKFFYQIPLIFVFILLFTFIAPISSSNATVTKVTKGEVFFVDVISYNSLEYSYSFENKVYNSTKESDISGLEVGDSFLVIFLDDYPEFSLSVSTVEYFFLTVLLVILINIFDFFYIKSKLKSIINNETLLQKNEKKVKKQFFDIRKTEIKEPIFIIAIVLIVFFWINAINSDLEKYIKTPIKEINNSSKVELTDNLQVNQTATYTYEYIFNEETIVYKSTNPISQSYIYLDSNGKLHYPYNVKVQLFFSYIVLIFSLLSIAFILINLIINLLLSPFLIKLIDKKYFEGIEDYKAVEDVICVDSCDEEKSKIIRSYPQANEKFNLRSFWYEHGIQSISAIFGIIFLVVLFPLLSNGMATLLLAFLSLMFFLNPFNFFNKDYSNNKQLVVSESEGKFFISVEKDLEIATVIEIENLNLDILNNSVIKYVRTNYGPLAFELALVDSGNNTILISGSMLDNYDLWKQDLKEIKNWIINKLKDTDK